MLMEIKHISYLKAHSKKDTIPLFIDHSTSNIRVLHGTKDLIKVSEINNNQIFEIALLQTEELNDVKSLIFEDLDNDRNKELLFVTNKLEIKIYRFTKNEFNLVDIKDFSKELLSHLEKNKLRIKQIKKLKDNLIIFGTNYGLFIYEYDKNFNFKFKKFIEESTVWEFVSLDFSKFLKNFFLVGLENKIIIMDDSFQKILEIFTYQRVYKIELFDFDKCGVKELICCTRKGFIIIYKIHIKNNSIIDYSNYFSKKIVNEEECFRAENPAINTFFLCDLDKNDKIDIIIGSHDNKVKIYEWNLLEKEIENIFECDFPRDQVYSVKIFNDRNNNLVLLYSTYVEEYSYNHLIIYYTAQSDFTKKNIQSIAERLFEEPEKFCLFLGAGFSYYEKDPTKGTPLAKDLIKDLYVEFKFSENDLPSLKYKNSLEYVFYYLKKIYPNKNFKDFIKERFEKKFYITKSVKVLKNLIEQGVIKQIFTVNWDTLLEDQLKNKIFLYYKHSDLTLDKVKLPLYIKLHGSSRDIDSIIASIDETEINEYNYSLILKRNFLKLFYDSKNFIFIGYSFNDRDFIDIFDNKLYNREINLYIFDPNPNKNMFKVVDKRIIMYPKEKHHYHIFKCKANEFFEYFYNTIKKIQKSVKNSLIQ